MERRNRRGGVSPAAPTVFNPLSANRTLTWVSSEEDDQLEFQQAARPSRLPDPEHGWIEPGDGARACLRERARQVVTDGVTEDRVRTLLDYGSSLSTARRPLTTADAATIVGVVAAEAVS